MATYPVDSTREQMLERPLPHSAEAERAILGAIVLDNSLVNQAVELLRPEDFYVRAHQAVFRSMIALSERGSEINPILLGEELRRDGMLEAVGGIAFISELTYGLPHGRSHDRCHPPRRQHLAPAGAPIRARHCGAVVSGASPGSRTLAAGTRRAASQPALATRNGTR